MLIRIGMLVLLLALGLAACSADEHQTPTTASEAPLSAAITESATDILPCTPIEGIEIDPCAGGGPLMAANNGLVILPDEPPSVRFFLDGGKDLTGVAHLVVRATYLPNTVRCISDDTTKWQSYFDQPDDNSPDGALHIKCFVDVRVNSYILGSGPSTLTVLIERVNVWPEETAAEIETRRGEMEALFLTGGESWELVVRDGGIIGVEQVLFLEPHYDVSIETWSIVPTWAWNVETKDDGTIIIVHPYRDAYIPPPDYEGDYTFESARAGLEIPLTTFTQTVTAANTARKTANGGRIGAATDLPMLVDNANDLDDYLRSVGAYDDADNPPEQPPPACGLVVSNQVSNSGLMGDCLALLVGENRLKGTGTLNWDTGTAMASWDGVTTAGTPARVTKLLLSNKSLTGSIPNDLGKLLELTHLDLSNNTLTGKIPKALEALTNLSSIKLSGNTFTGCIPLGLKDIANNDLASLNLLYCQPPAPANLAAGTIAETSVPLSWSAVANTNKYRVEYKLTSADEWITDSDTLTDTSHTVDQLACGSQYEFRVSAYGSGTTYAAAWSDSSAPVTATTTACVSPVFSEESYAFSVFDNVDVGTAVGTVEATDPNGDALSYSITAGNEDGKFSIGTSTGAITVAGSLDHEVTSTYTLTVEASDGSNTASVSVVITVKKGNDPPVFPEEGYTFPIHESEARFTGVGYAVAVDPDGDLVTYRLTGGNVGNKFAISANNGLIVTQNPLNYANRSSYTLTVRATDARGATADGTVTINVIQTAEDPPPPPIGLRTTLEDTGDLIASYNEFPNSSMNRLRYRTDSTAGWTTLDPVAYWVRSQTISDTTCGVTYEVQVQGQGDGVTYTDEWGDWSKSVSAPIPLCPAPAFEESYDLAVAEDAEVGDEVGTVTATHPDPDKLTYAITAGNDDGKFALDGEGVITVAGELDREETSSYTLTVEATDPRGKKGTATVNIAVTNVNETPAFDEEEYAFSIAEDAAVGAAVGTVAATDPDEDTLTYSITAGDADSQFSIDADGAITVAAALDFETTPSYTLTVTAEDEGGASDTASVAVTVTDVNEAPSFDEEEYAFTVAEDAAVGAAVGTVSAIDQDEDTLAYSITAGDADGQFSIDADGAITVAAALDKETAESYTLTVTATDPDGESGTATGTITVSDVNETPAFGEDSYSFSIAEDAAVGASVGSVSATDPDEDTLTYSITAGDADSQFSIDAGGQVTVAKALDFETTPSYTLTVTTEDEGGESDTASVAVTVTDVNEAPAFDEADYAFTVAEDAVVGASVGTVSATDQDEDTLTYSITAGDTDSQFSIDADGDITVAAALDKETTESYSLTVEAADPEGESDTASVTITVSDVNETPAFDEDSYSFSIAEDAAVGASVGSVSAADPDEDTLTYSITAGDADSHFSIDADGAITVAAALDFETTPSYTLTVTAEDEGGLSDTATVTITVTDANDPPAFAVGSYQFGVAEDADVGTTVATLAATDQDEDALTFSITAGDPSSQFSVDANGAVTVAKALDFETASSYTMTVEASDGNDGTATSTLIVNVTDVNETPSFDKAEYAFRVAENAAVGATVGSAPATDPDGDTLAYSITAGDASDQFSIGAGGAITVAKALDYETTRSYTLTVQAADPDGLSDTAEVAVTVRNVADTLPPAPGGLTVSHDGAFVLSWDSVAGANNYRARYREGDGAWDNLAATTGTKASLNPGGLPCGRTFEFAVQSHGNGRRHTAAWGPWSDPVEQAMDACPIHDRPWNLRASVTGTTVTLNWHAPTDGTVVIGYQILRRIPAREGNLSIIVENTENTATTYTDSGLEANTRYVYRVKAVTADGLTRLSNSASATTGQ